MIEYPHNKSAAESSDCRGAAFTINTVETVTDKTHRYYPYNHKQNYF